MRPVILAFFSVFCIAASALCLGDKEVVDYIIRANQLCAEGKPEEAISELNEAAEAAIAVGDKSQTALLLFNRGRALEQAGMFAKALEDYSWVIKSSCTIF